MGYRTYIGSMLKNKHQEIKDLSEKEYIDKYITKKMLEDKLLSKGQENYFHLFDLIDQKWFKESLFEFGKYFEVDTNDNNVFSNFNDEDDILIILEKEDIIKIREEIRVSVLEGYKTMKKALENVNITNDEMKKDMKKWNYLAEKKESNSEEAKTLWDKYEHYGHKIPKEYLENEVDGKIFIWENHSRIIGSWKWEYEYFQLNYIIENFDWEENVMVYYGY